MKNGNFDTSIKNMGKPRTDMPLFLLPNQSDLVTGTMLGDATINRKCGYYSFTQKLANEEYVDHVGQVLEPFTIHYDTREYEPGFWRKTIRTCSCQVFKELRKKWYTDRRKIVPPDLKLNPKIIGYWYADDGYLLAPRKRLEFSTNGFQDEEVRFLIELLAEFDIRAALHRDPSRKPIIRVKMRSFLNTVEFLKPHVPWKCMAYKLNLKKMPKTKAGWGANKLTKFEVRQIRTLYNTGKYSQGELGKMFRISRRMAHLIINNKAHPEANVGLRGSAEVSVTFRYEANPKPSPLVSPL
jgi:hypothetical protein